MEQRNNEKHEKGAEAISPQEVQELRSVLSPLKEELERAEEYDRDGKRSQSFASAIFREAIAERGEIEKATIRRLITRALKRVCKNDAEFSVGKIGFDEADVIGNRTAYIFVRADWVGEQRSAAEMLNYVEEKAEGIWGEIARLAAKDRIELRGWVLEFLVDEEGRCLSEVEERALEQCIEAIASHRSREDEDKVLGSRISLHRRVIVEADPEQV